MRCDGLIRTERARMPRARASARAWRVAWQTALSCLGRLPSALRSARPPPVRAERLNCCAPFAPSPHPSSARVLV